MKRKMTKDDIVYDVQGVFCIKIKSVKMYKK